MGGGLDCLFTIPLPRLGDVRWVGLIELTTLTLPLSQRARE